jgi:elongation factor P--(R)-beta-lysine ligase
MNSCQTDILYFRHRAKKAIRSLFDDEGFIELDTPYLLLSNTPDPFIDPIFAKTNVSQNDLQLHTSPEVWLKRGIGLGLQKIYQMARVFRDDPPSDHHSREFTMLEWYRVDAVLTDLIRDCEAIFNQTEKIACEDRLIAYEREFSIEKIDLDQAFRHIADIDLPGILHQIARGDVNYFQTYLANRQEYLPRDASFADAFFHVMLKYIEPNLPKDRPVALCRWPVQLAALAAPCEDDPKYCDRFEIYYRGLEIANAYQECCDLSVIRNRFIRENQERRALNKPEFPISNDLLEAVSKMPKTAGIALGIDRLFLAILGRDKIAEIIFGYQDQ